MTITVVEDDEARGQMQTTFNELMLDVLRLNEWADIKVKQAEDFRARAASKLEHAILIRNQLKQFKPEDER